jgi:alginate O-acetyltransferase complex protein AlgI
MLFNSLEYLVFLPISWIAFWSAPSHWRVHVMLVASYVFYASWSVPYAAMIFGLVVMNYLFGIALGRTPLGQRGRVLGAFVCIDLAVLGLFKYFDFGVSSITAGANWLFGLSLDPPLLRLVLPLGISFFTFEFIHYLVDIYRGDVPVHSFSKFHVFSAFFPTQIAGPIKRFQDFVPSLASLDRFDSALAREGLWLIGRGLVKKVLLGDRMAVWVNDGFRAASDGAIGTTDAWVTALAFALQIYFDFSGYTDLARGSAALFGFRIPINFDMPYLATSLADFWRRWHISLSSWLRDYVFIPLGGSRRPAPIVMFNLFVTFVLCGLWHGAAWNFVVFGVVWGIGMAVHWWWHRTVPLPSHPLVSVAGWAFTMTFYVASLAIFRASSLAAAGVMLEAMAGHGVGSGTQTARGTLAVVGVAVALLATWMVSRYDRWPRVSIPTGSLRPVALGAAASITILFASVAAPAATEVFFYFQF